MPYTDAQRLTAVQTAIDAIIDAIATGDYTTEYRIENRMWRGESPRDLLRQLREEEQALRLRIAMLSRTGGGRVVVSFENEPQ